MVDVLQQYSKFPLPQQPPADIAETGQPLRPRQARTRRRRRSCGSSAPTCRCWRNWPASRRSRSTSATSSTTTSFAVDPAYRGVLKQALIAVGYPAEDLAGYTEGAALPTEPARRWRATGLPFHVRDYQREAADVFYAGGDVRGGSGVIVLPCGAGKTIVGIAAMALLQKSTLVLTTSITAVKQWQREILDKTDLTEDAGRASTPARRRTSAR